jgi:hypothetical protein
LRWVIVVLHLRVRIHVSSARRLGGRLQHIGGQHAVATGVLAYHLREGVSAIEPVDSHPTHHSPPDSSFGHQPENPGSQGFRVATDRCSPCSCIHRGENGQGGNGASRDARWNPVHATRDERRCCVLRRAMRRQGPPRRGAVSTPPELLVPNPLTPTVVLPPSSRITGGARVLCQETARGRALFATRAFAAGEQVLRERPLVAIQVCLRAEIVTARTVND